VFDFAGWVARAAAFTAGLARLPGEMEVQTDVDPPITAAALEALEASLSRRLPPSLRAFLQTATARCACRYLWEPRADARGPLEAVFPSQGYLYGGATLCDAAQMAED
jgi:hypothetical protein